MALVTSLRFAPNQVFDGARHRLDLVAHSYLKKVDNCPSDLSPVAVTADGNCLYNSMVLLINDPTIGVAELRGLSLAYPVLASITWFAVVRVIMELTRNERFYESLHMASLGPVHIALKTISKNYSYSESYEIHALCNVLGCNIQSFCPSIGLHPNVLPMLNKLFTPIAPQNVECTIRILWCHTMMETDVKISNRGHWSPNHFVPLVSNGTSVGSDNGSTQPIMKVLFVRERFPVTNF